MSDKIKTTEEKMVDKAEEISQELSPEEAKAHKAHLKKQAQYKKKKRKLITLLSLESVFLIILIAGYVGISYASNLWNNKVQHGEKITLEAPIDEPTETEPLTTEEATLPGISMDDPTKEASASSSDAEDTTAVDPSGESIDPSSTETGESTEAPVPLEKEQKSGFVTYACFGVDARDSRTLAKGTQGDVCMIISLNKATGEVKIASVYRDFYFEAESGKMCKLTDCYARYGCEKTVAAINRNFDLEIQDYVVVNWLAIADAVDAMEGLTVDMTYAEAKALNDYVYETMVATGRKKFRSVEVKAGEQTLDGVGVVCYARIRKGVGDDYARTARQRKVIDLMLQKAKTMSIGKLITIANLAAEEVYTSLEPIEILTLVSDYAKYHIGGTTGFPFQHKTMEYIYADNLNSNVKQLHTFLYGSSSYQPSARVNAINQAHLDDMARYWH